MVVSPPSQMVNRVSIQQGIFLNHVRRANCISPFPATLPTSIFVDSLRVQHRNASVEASNMVTTVLTKRCLTIYPHPPTMSQEIGYSTTLEVKNKVRLKRLLSEGYREQANCWFAGMRTRKEAKVQHYNVMLAQVGTVAAAQDILTAMTQEGVHPDSTTFTHLLGTIARVGDSHSLRLLYAEYTRHLENKTLLGDGLFYKILIEAAGRLRLFDLIEQIVQDTHRHSVSFDAATYTAAVCAFAQIDDVKRIEWVLKEMRDHGVAPTTTTISTSLKAYKRTGNIPHIQDIIKHTPQDDSMCYGLLGLMIDYCQSSPSIVPSQPPSPTHSKSLDRTLHIDLNALQVCFDKICLAGRPSTRTYTLLATTYGHAGDVLGMEDVLSEMGAKEIPFSYVTYHEVLTVYSRLCSEFGVKRMRTMIRQMNKAGVVPDGRVYTLLIHSYAQIGHLDGMASTIQAVHSLCHPLDIKPYTSAIAAYGRAGCLAEAEDMFASMKQRGIKPTSYVYNALVEAYCKAGNFDRVDKILQQMKEEGLSPGFMTYTSILSAYKRRGDDQAADRVFNEIKHTGIVLDAILFEPMFSLHAQRNNVMRVRELQRQMEELGLQPTNRILNIIAHLERRMI